MWPPRGQRHGGGQQGDSIAASCGKWKSGSVQVFERVDAGPQQHFGEALRPGAGPSGRSDTLLTAETASSLCLLSARERVKRGEGLVGTEEGAVVSSSGEGALRRRRGAEDVRELAGATQAQQQRGHLHGGLVRRGVRRERGEAVEESSGARRNFLAALSGVAGRTQVHPPVVLVVGRAVLGHGPAQRRPNKRQTAGAPQRLEAGRAGGGCGSSACLASTELQAKSAEYPPGGRQEIDTVRPSYGSSVTVRPLRFVRDGSSLRFVRYGSSVTVRPLRFVRVLFACFCLLLLAFACF